MLDGSITTALSCLSHYRCHEEDDDNREDRYGPNTAYRWGPKVTGEAIYTEDLPLPPGALYGAILRSPYAHARLVSIGVQQAEQLPGGHAAVRREYLGHLNPFLDRASYGTEGEGAAPVIALDKVRYEGEPVAAVAAETPALARQALDCIKELPITPEKVLQGLGKLA